jgi:hypothetical protein
MGLLAQMSENLHLDGFNVKIKEGSNRFFTTQADATHFSGCKGKIISENGLYEGMMDDAINIHGTYLKITKTINSKSVIARYMHPQAYGFLWGEAGDKVQFVKPGTMELTGETNTIKSIEPYKQDEINGAKVFKITFENKLPHISMLNKGIENLTWTPEVIFRNNLIRNNRARGALFSTPKTTVVENNTFDHTSGTAILLCGDCNGWFETGACKDVTIRNNTFINALTSNFQFTNAVISIYPEIPYLAFQKKYFHSGIIIENNTFKTFDRPILYAKSTENLEFRNNTIEKNNEFTPFHWNSATFLLERCRNILLQGNIFSNGYNFNPETDIKVVKGEAETIKFEQN